MNELQNLYLNPENVLSKVLKEIYSRLYSRKELKKFYLQWRYYADQYAYQTNKRRGLDVDLILVHLMRRWPDISKTLGNSLNWRRLKNVAIMLRQTTAWPDNAGKWKRIHGRPN